MHVLVISRNTWGGVGAWLNNWGFTCIYFCEDFLTKCLGADLANLLYLYMFVPVSVTTLPFVMVPGLIPRVSNLGIPDISITFV